MVDCFAHEVREQVLLNDVSAECSVIEVYAGPWSVEDHVAAHGGIDCEGLKEAGRLLREDAELVN